MLLIGRKLKNAEAQFKLRDLHRFRTRSEAELRPRELGLVELAAILDRLKVQYYLADGTLLGAVRDGDLIPWDDDVGLCMKHEDFQDRREALKEELIAHGFEVEEGSTRNPKLNIFKRSEKFELTSWRLRGRMRVRWGLKMPARFLEAPGLVTLRGRVYPSPSPVEDYLAHRYGDWQTPRVGRGTHSPAIKTRWSLVKRRIRRLSPQWVLQLFKRNFLPKGL